MKKAYFAISYSNRNKFDKEIACLQHLCSENNIDLLIFVDKYNFQPNQEREMMQTAFEEIDSADIFIAELTTKAIGVGIEIGYARAKEKSIFYLKRKGAEHSTTAAGSADYIIEYEDVLDLENQISITDKFIGLGE